MTNKPGPKPISDEMRKKSRPIRMTDSEWEVFKNKLGPEWLREQIAKAAQEPSNEGWRAKINEKTK